MKRILSIILASVMLLGCLTLSASAESYISPGEGYPIFSDVTDGKWYTEYVYSAFRKGIMVGTTQAGTWGIPETTFEPNATLTRAMLVTILIRFVEEQYGKELTVPEGYVRSFSDVKEDKWYTEQAYIAKANGIVTGYPDGTFRPNRKVTREEAVLMICRVLFNTKLTGESAVYILNDAPEQPFKDADRITMGIDAERYTELLVRMGVLNGDGNGFFNPKADITRAETAKIIVKLTDVPMLNESNMADYAELSCDDEKPTWKAGTIQYLNVSVKFNTAFCYYGAIDRFIPIGKVGCKAMMSFITRPAITLNVIEKGSLKTYMTYNIDKDAEVGVYDLTVEIPFASKVIEDCVTIIK